MSTKTALLSNHPGEAAQDTGLAVSLRDTASVRPYERNPRVNDQAVEEREYKKNYRVFSDGRIFSNRCQRFLKPRNNNRGYQRIQINERDEYVHRIVALCFLDNPHEYPEVNHIDGNKKNNCSRNLEWCTRSQNNKHAFETGLRNYSELKAMSVSAKAQAAKRLRRKYSDADLKIIRGMIRQGHSDGSIVKIVGGSRGAVFQIRTGKSYKEEITNEYSNCPN